MRYTKIALGAAVLLLTCRADASQVVRDDGTSVQFEVVRSPSGPRPELAEGVMGDQEGVHRLLVDFGHGKYFGYTVRVSPVAKGRYRFEVGPLDPAQQARFAALYGGSVGDPYAIEYPGPQDVDPGEPLLFELLVNPATGEKLYDLIRVQSPAKDREARLSKLPAPGPGEIRLNDAVIKINGQPVLMRSGTPPGTYVYFFVCGRGRFVVTTERVPSLEMLPATLGDDSKTITFTIGADRYEWRSAEPFVIGSPRLWVWHDREYRCRPDETSGHGSGRDLTRLRTGR